MSAMCDGDAIVDIMDAPAFFDVVPRASRKFSALGQNVGPGKWKTGDGRVLYIVDMAHDHLLNTIALIERRFRELQDTFRDGALDILRIFPKHAELVEEARRRRLLKRVERGDFMVTE